MKISKYRITITGRQGSASVLYEDDVFKSLITEFKPALTDKELNWTLSHIPSTELALNDWLVVAAKGKVQLEHISLFAPDQVIALFCRLYEDKTGRKYKATGPDAGKIKELCKQAAKWQPLLECYFKSSNFLFKNKYSIANLTKYWNELDVEAFGIRQGKDFPLPYDQDYFASLNMMDQREYHKYLHKAGYIFQHNPGRGGKWIKKEFI